MPLPLAGMPPPPLPLPPPLLDSRTRAEAKARVDAAQAATRQAQAAVNRARYERDFAKQESERALAVVQQGGLARSDADRAVSTYRSAQEQLSSANFGARVAEHELKLAQTAPAEDGSPPTAMAASASSCCRI